MNTPNKRQRMKGPNLFNVLGLTHERYHSKMLAWLLDPRGTHGLERQPLEQFLEIVEVTAPNLDRVQIIPEEALETRRPDLSVEGENLYGIIEVKVRMSALDANQLREQNTSARKRASGRIFWHVLIVPTRTIPTEIQRVVRDHEIKLCTWREIADCLERWRNGATVDSSAFNILLQYQLFVEETILMFFRGFDLENATQFLDHMWPYVEAKEIFEGEVARFLHTVTERIRDHTGEERWLRLQVRDTRTKLDAGSGWQAWSAVEPAAAPSWKVSVYWGFISREGCLKAYWGAELYGGEFVKQYDGAFREMAKRLGLKAGYNGTRTEAHYSSTQEVSLDPWQELQNLLAENGRRLVEGLLEIW